MYSIFLIKPQRQKTVTFAAKYQLKRVTTVAILNCSLFHRFCCLMKRKCKSLNKQCFYRNNIGLMFCGIKRRGFIMDAIYNVFGCKITISS